MRKEAKTRKIFNCNLLKYVDATDTWTADIRISYSNQIASARVVLKLSLIIMMSYQPKCNVPVWTTPDDVSGEAQYSCIQPLTRSTM